MTPTSDEERAAGAPAGWAAVADAGLSEGERVAALGRLANAVGKDPDLLRAALALLCDGTEPAALRLALFSTVQAASFQTARFAPVRPEYLQSLRSVATDADPELRQRALGALAREQDAVAQTLLLDGLNDPAKALLPPEKALQLLSYDVHAEAYPVARQLLQSSTDPAVRCEALRLLAGDAGSTGEFERILDDKSESDDLRRLSATALHGVAPSVLQARARAIVLDNGESDELKATSLTAIAHFGDAASLEQDEDLHQCVGHLHDMTDSEDLKACARQFLGKYRR
ncbi:hypothetical protein [Paludibacterium paludis]|uniref:HEAT repeat protein n=1 Tax=Paludibacterium paludis TaxID=1225769 RepID=A0A918P5Z6_9NEIS|nr:hypothetical protein [Paludibacterium paludis]GGY23308.1 hypothetical protein GCM10011289_28870 [Paludibacterium paludis]